MFGMMQGSRLDISGDLAYDAVKIRDESVRGQADINALASKSDRGICVMLWNYHDDDITDVPSARVDLTINGLSEGRILMCHYRIDKHHSNAYTVWKHMGSPQTPTAEQIEQLEAAGQLEMFPSPEWLTVKDGQATIHMHLPRQAVSVITIEEIVNFHR